jgi:hypothetical protein
VNARAAAVGDLVTTDFSGQVTTHRVTDRTTGTRSQSGIMLQVDPPVPKSSGRYAWIVADWFTPAAPVAQPGLF